MGKSKISGMSLTIQERRRVITEPAPRFQKARKGQKSLILEEFVALTELDRHYEWEDTLRRETNPDAILR